MPYKTGDLKGQLTAPELRRMIKAHNKLVSINIPPKTNRDGLIKLIEDAGYKIDHAKQVLRVDKVVRKKNIKLPPPPTPKTAEEKKQAKDKKDAKAKAVSDEKKLIKQDAKTEGIKQAVALKKVRDKYKSKPVPKKPTPKPSSKKPEKMVNLDKFKSLDEYDKFLVDNKSKYDLVINWEEGKESVWDVGTANIRSALKRLLDDKKPKLIKETVKYDIGKEIKEKNKKKAEEKKKDIQKETKQGSGKNRNLTSKEKQDIKVFGDYFKKIESDKMKRQDIYRSMFNLIKDKDVSIKTKLDIIIDFIIIYDKHSKGGSISDYFTQGLGLKGKIKNVGKLLARYNGSNADQESPKILNEYMKYLYG